MNSRPILGLTMGDPAGIGRSFACGPCTIPACCAGACRCCSAMPVWSNVSAPRPLKIEDEDENEGRERGLPGRFPCRMERPGQIKEPLIVDCAAIDAVKIKPGKSRRPAARRDSFHRTGDPVGVGKKNRRGRHRAD